MKRFISVLLVLILLTAAVCASAEEKNCEIQALIRTGDQEIQTNLNIYLKEDRIYFTSSLIPDICIQLPDIDTEDTLNALAELSRNLNDGKTIEIIRDCVKEWIVFMQPEIRTGNYSGDAFEQASSMQHIVFEGKYASLNVLDGENIVMTVSANMSEPDCILLITGCGYSGKNYYSRILAEKKEGRLDITESLYADDLKAGYPGLKENSLIYTRNSTIEWNTEGIQYSVFLFPANNAMTPIAGSGTFRNTTSGRCFDGEIHFSGYDGFRVTITADLKNGGIDQMPARMIDLDQADETELIGLGTEIGVALLPLLFQAIESLPPEYSAPISTFMHY